MEITKNRAGPPSDSTNSIKPLSGLFKRLPTVEKKEFEDLLIYRSTLDDKGKKTEFNKNKQLFWKALMALGAKQLDLPKDIKKELWEHFQKREKDKEDKIILELNDWNTYDFGYIDWWAFIVVWKYEVNVSSDDRKVRIKAPYKVIDKNKYPEACKYVKTKFENLQEDEKKWFYD